MAGGVVHFEIPADDEDRAREFYSSAFGWTISPDAGDELRHAHDDAVG